MDEIQRAQQALEAAREMLAAAVAQARAEGRTWADIGGVLGMSKQAAYKRFGKPTDPTTGKAVQGHSTELVVDLTERVFRLVAEGDYDRLEGLMHPQTVQELPRDVIAEVWRRSLAEHGALESFTDTHVEVPGGGRVEPGEQVLGTVVGATVLECEAGQVVGRVAVTERLQVVGILFAPMEHGPLPF